MDSQKTDPETDERRVRPFPGAVAGAEVPEVPAPEGENRRPLEVLLVDDDAFVRTMLGSLLSSAGHTVITAANGAEALEKCAAHPAIELVISDMNMAPVDGLEFIRAFRQDEPDVPVIILTVNDEITVALEAIRSGADDYLLKDENVADTIFFSVERVLKPYFLKRRNQELLAELRRKNRELERLSFLDGLTGIPNRRYFDRTIIREWTGALRDGRPISLIMLDIDHFKAYNDIYGHLAGDECLKRVAGSLESRLKTAGDLIFRYGGEEFAAILPARPVDEALAMAREIHETVHALALPHGASPIGEQITVSQGVAGAVPGSGTDHRSLISAADNALYRAKQEGRNRIIPAGAPLPPSGSAGGRDHGPP